MGWSSLRSNESKTTKSEWLIEASELLVENTLKILSSKEMLEAMSCVAVLNPEMLDCWPQRTQITLPYTLGNTSIFQTL